MDPLTFEEVEYLNRADEKYDTRKVNEGFESLKDLETRIRAYTKEAGFGLLMMHSDIIKTLGGHYRVAKCSRGITRK